MGCWSRPCCHLLLLVGPDSAAGAASLVDAAYFSAVVVYVTSKVQGAARRRKGTTAVDLVPMGLSWQSAWMRKIVMQDTHNIVEKAVVDPLSCEASSHSRADVMTRQYYRWRFARKQKKNQESGYTRRSRTDRNLAAFFSFPTNRDQSRHARSSDRDTPTIRYRFSAHMVFN